MRSVSSRSFEMSMARSPSVPTTTGSRTVFSPIRSSAKSDIGGSFRRPLAESEAKLADSPVGDHDDDGAPARTGAARDAHRRDCRHALELTLLDHEGAAAAVEESA